jgi:predicted fused transcriptional regulator/phosphomethylpyrimidine kinase
MHKYTKQLNIYLLVNSKHFFSTPVPRVGTNVVIALDGSRNVKPDDFTKMKNSIKKIINSLVVSPEDSRVGLLEYSDRVNVIFHLNEYNNKKDVQDAIDVIQPSLGNGRVLDEV